MQTTSLCLISFLLLLATPAAATDFTGTVQIPGRGAEDAVIYVADVPGSPPADAEAPSIDQRQLRFIPHVLVVQKGQKVFFPNTDLSRHSVFSPSKAHRFQLGIYPPGVRKEEVFPQAGVVALLCNVHPDMNAFIVVVDSPFWARTGADGSFAIKSVPSGQHQVVVWHEGLGELRQKVDFRGATVHSTFVLRRDD